MNKPAETLKPCPFCGGEAEVSYYTTAQSSEPKGYYVECVSCAAAGPSVEIQGQMPDRVEYTQAKALAAWNARHRQEQRSAEAVAWMYERDDGSKDLLLDCNGEYARHFLESGATETPLFTTPPASGAVAWMPMETAPKDGTRILVSFGNMGVREVAWLEPENASFEIWCVDDNKHGPFALRGWSDHDGSLNAPTHWQPLPTPPEAV